MEVRQETAYNFFYNEFKIMLSQFDISKYQIEANRVIQLLTEAIQYYQNTNVLKNNGVTLIIPKYEKENPLKCEELNKIILSLTRELDKGYDLYLLVSERKEDEEFDEDLTLYAGENIRQSKEILQGIIKKIEEEREWMRNPRAQGKMSR